MRVVSSLVELDLPRSRHREVTSEGVLEGVCEAGAVKFQHLDCREGLQGRDRMSIVQQWDRNLEVGDIHY